jgi:hypothetical protein
MYDAHSSRSGCSRDQAPFSTVFPEDLKKPGVKSHKNHMFALTRPKRMRLVFVDAKQVELTQIKDLLFMIKEIRVYVKTNVRLSL